MEIFFKVFLKHCTIVVFQKYLEKRTLLSPPPEKGRHRLGVIVSIVILICYHHPPNPLPSQGRGVFRAKDILNTFPNHDTRRKP
jgi:hypothetical protein